ncbi:MAG: dual specificity protein phosphatase family protein [Candidatus Kapabacteria bacterium]|nr:dual specificity protein phosphatase family protein [Candidatus Kapabacteria bacterium]
MKKPYPRSYWVEEKKLLAGFYPGSTNPESEKIRINALLDFGIRTFINLTDANEMNSMGISLRPYHKTLWELSEDRNIEITFINIPIIDLEIPNKSTMKAILDAIDCSIAAGLPVYIHCWGGIGRTGAVVCCWMLTHGKATPENVFDVLSGLRYSQNDPEFHRSSPETEEQKQFVRDWK